MVKKLVFMTVLAVFSMTFASTAIAKSYIVKLTGKALASGEDSLEFQTTKGWKSVYYFGLDDKSRNTLENAIKKKSCIRITENKNPSELVSGAVISPAKCPVKKN